MIVEFELNAPPQGIFFSGSEVSGIMNVHVRNESTRHIIKKIQVTLVGIAHFSTNLLWEQWEEGGERGPPPQYGGPRSSQYRSQNPIHISNEFCLHLSTIVWMKEQEPIQELHIGMNSFPFRFLLPDRLPSSFEGSYGWIRYYVAGRFGTTAPGKRSHVKKALITVVDNADINVSQLQRPLRAEKQKTLRCLGLCASALITFTVELPRRGFCRGDIIPLKVTLENGSSRQLRLRAQLLQVIVYTAQIRTEHKVVASITSGQLEPRTTSTWNPEELVVSGHIQPTLRSCGIISIEYFLRVSVTGPNFIGYPNVIITVDIAVTIGNVPLHSTTSAPNTVSMVSVAQPQHFSPQQPASSMHLTQGIYPPSHQPPQVGPHTDRGDFQSAPPPPYEDVVGNPNEYMHVTRFWLVICTDNIDAAFAHSYCKAHFVI